MFNINFDLLIKIALVAVALLICCVVKYYFPASKEGVAVEQVAEKVIEKESGVSVDFSPDIK